MQLTKTTLAAVMAFSSRILAAPTNTAKATDCVVNSLDVGHWPEDGLTRHRALFSAINTDPAQHCWDWAHPQDGDCRGGTNLQCGWSDELQSWHVDYSFVAGPLGDLIWGRCVEHTRAQWMAETGCRTG